MGRGGAASLWASNLRGNHAPSVRGRLEEVFFVNAELQLSSALVLGGVFGALIINVINTRIESLVFV
jgi:hypothetical protein